jgi:membrane associated rhomboid family serine protease
MTPWVLRLLLANVFTFIVTVPSLGLWAYWLGFQAASVLARPWTPLTYMFLHGGFLHLLFNMIALFFFGPRLESRLGGMRFLGLYFASGLAGAAFSIFTPHATIIGASGAVFGVLLAFARYYPKERIYIWGVLPVESRVLVLFLAGFSIWAGLSGAGGNVAHFAHLGGFAGGWIFLKIMERNSPAERFRRRVEAASLPARPSPRDLNRWRQVDPGLLHPLNREEFDRILAKAEAYGIPALSDAERAFMERMSGGVSGAG